MEGPLAWAGNKDGMHASWVARNKRVSSLPQPIFKVLLEQLGPGELDAAARACKTWATQLSLDVAHCNMCLPASYEALWCQLEQVCKRFKSVHSWKVWLSAGRNWAVLEELKILFLLSRYKAEKLQLDSRLGWNTKDTDLPTLNADVLSWMPSLRSLQTLTLSHITLADHSSLRYLSFLPNLTSLTFGIPANSGMDFDWSSNGLASILPYLCKLQQVVEIEVHVEGAQQLPQGLAQQVRQVLGECGKLQRFKVALGKGWGVIRNSESVVFERVSNPGRRTDWLSAPVSTTAAAAAEEAQAAGVQQQQDRCKRWLEMMDPSAARAATAAGLDLSALDLPDPSEPKCEAALGANNSRTPMSRNCAIRGLGHADVAAAAATAAAGFVLRRNHAAGHFQRAAAAADQVAAARGQTSAGPPLKTPQLNRCLVKPDSVLVTHLKLISLTGPAALYRRLQQQLYESPAIALQDVYFDFHVRTANWTPAVVGGGHFWQLLLRQMLLLKGLTVRGLPYCEAADDAPHFWRAVGQLRGLTKLCFDINREEYNASKPLPPEVQEPAAAAATHSLMLDALFMEVITGRLQGLKTLEFTSEVPVPDRVRRYEYQTLRGFGQTPIAMHPSSRMDPSRPVLAQLTRMTNLTSLSLIHWPLHFKVDEHEDAQLDMAWLPVGLTRLKLGNLNLSCLGKKKVTADAAFAAGHMALLLQQRRAKTAVAATAAAADAGIAAALGLQDPAGSSSSSNTMRCIQPPVILSNLEELEIRDCFGVKAAIIGCLAHSTGLRMLSLSADKHKPEPVSLAAIAWMWPRLQTVNLTTHSVGSHRDVSAAAEGGLGESGHKLLPDLLDPSVTPELAAAWLWQLDAPLSSSSSSSAAAASVRACLLADICSRGSSSPSWADPEDFAVFAASLPNLSKLNLMLSDFNSWCNWNSESPMSLFRLQHLLALAHAQRLRELKVVLPDQPSYQSVAAETMSLTQLSSLWLLDLDIRVQPAHATRQKANASQTAAAAGRLAAAATGSGAFASAAEVQTDVQPPAAAAVAVLPTATAAAGHGLEAEAAAAAAGQEVAAAVARNVVAPPPPPPAAAAVAARNNNSSSSVRCPKPKELLAEMRTNMPNTSVFLSIFQQGVYT